MFANFFVVVVVVVCLAAASGSAFPPKAKAYRKSSGYSIRSSSSSSSGTYSGSSDHVTSGLDSNKKLNAAEHPKEIEIADFAAAANNRRNVPERKTGNRKKPETAPDVVRASSPDDWSSPLSSEGSKVLAVMTDVSESLASLRDLLNGLKYQNQYLYKQMRRILAKSCNRFSLEKQEEHHTPQHDEGDSKLTSPSSSFSRRVASSSSSSPDDVENSIDWFPSFGLGALIASEAERPRPAEPETATTETKKKKCPAQFSHSAETGRCYRLYSDRVTWVTARERCRSAAGSKGNLVSIDSYKEQKVVNELARANPGTQHCDFWIGLTRQGQMSTHDWYWEGDGHLPAFSNWNENEPNNGNGNENCAQMLWVFNWKWNDAPCGHGNACFVCETRSRDVE